MQKKVIVLSDTTKKEVVRSLAEISPWLERTSDVIGWYEHPAQIETHALDGVDYLIVFGGDGLLLAVARCLAEYRIPVIGVNFGKLGFLAEFVMSEFQEQFPGILAGKNETVSRMMLSCQVRREKKVIHSATALNDAVIKCCSASRILYISLYIDGEAITSFGGDGAIVATPVGSTAYSLSAGGPVVAPTLSAFVLTPICPHVLTLRPLVISSSRTIKIEMLPPYPGEVTLTIDGQVSIPLQNQDTIVISQSPHTFSLVQTQKRSFFSILQEKLAWGEVRLNFKNYH